NKNLLTSNDAQEARDYIAKRGISEKTCETFMLGYIPDKADWLYKLLKKNNYSDEILALSGLFNKGNLENGFFRNRIMFPIRTWQGNCVAFSGRDLSGFSQAKYKNSPETVLYSKRNVLFGFYEGLAALKEKKEIIICEGNFDVISLHQAGFENSCATCGTALTDEHIRLIKRYCEKVYLLFDSDKAGQTATIKALMLCQKNDIANYVIRIEGAKDASELLEKEGPQAIQKCCVNSAPGFSYLVSSALKLYDIRQPKGKYSVLKEVKPYLDATNSEIERQEYIRYLANSLRVSEQQVLNDYLKQQDVAPVKEEIQTVKKDKYDLFKLSSELTAMLILLKNRDRFEQFRSEVKLSHLTDKDAQMLYTVLEDAIRQEIRTDDMILQMIDDPDLRNLAVSAFTNKMYQRMDIDKSLSIAIYRIKLNQLEDKKAMIQRLLMGGEMDNADEKEFSNLLQMKISVDKDIQELKAEMEDKE
ncbi:MAG: toprim domain-containing protein, partial [Sphaerochaetaceae bacterium]|nr:toprim domain-containing protein [Sphaerochaetaceae bacterium]